MSTEQLDRLLALPLEERVELAQALWQSIDGGTLADAEMEERRALQEALRRDGELNAGTVKARTHTQVMDAARQALGCK